jgi:antitoxin component YwqK of YwqJK toxin-antitoxin module
VRIQLRKYILIIVCLTCSSAQAQIRSGDFIMGNFEPIDTHKKIDVRFDSINNRLLQYYGISPEITVSWPTVAKSDYWMSSINTHFNFDTIGVIDHYDSSNNDSLQINTEYWSHRLSSNHLISYGNVELKKSQRNKVRWLQFYPSLGDIETLKSYKNIKYLTLPFGYRIPYFGYTNSHLFSNQSSISLNNTLEKMTTLEFMDLGSLPKVEHNNFHSIERSDLTLIQGLSPKVFALPNLTKLRLWGATFLPVNFHDFEKFEFLHVNFDGSTHPELINLALVMHSFDKDTSSGNWNKYLQLGKISPEFKLPSNGKYKSYYKNGTPLCEGEYLDNQPHGQWKFWFPDGVLCESREYDNGMKTGEWIFYSDSTGYRSYSIRDTIHYFHFENNLLTKRIDKEFDSYPPKTNRCNDFPNSQGHISVLRGSYTFEENISGSRLMSHSFCSVRMDEDSIGYVLTTDTINGFQEALEINDSTWNYTFFNYFNLCPTNTQSLEYYASGKNGDVYNFSSLTEKEDKHKGQFGFMRTSTVDFNSGKINVTQQFLIDRQLGIYKSDSRKEQEVNDVLPPAYKGDN